VNNQTADALVADARRAVHESLALLPAWEADRVRALVADLETAVESQTAIRCAEQQRAFADRAALRKLIADALADAEGWKFAPGFKTHSPTYRGYERQADAVLAVLPSTVDRAAVLREAADVAERLMDERYGPDCSYAIGGLDAARELRRMADEAQPAQPQTGEARPGEGR
jgi:hypothetical protein